MLPIPATSPTIASCHVLKLSYHLTVTLAVPGTIDLHVTIPVIIGKVPFRGQPQVTYNRNSYMHPLYPPKPFTESPPSPMPQALTYSVAHPPVYIGDDNYTIGETQYAPVYGFVTDYQLAPPPCYSEAVASDGR